MAFVNSKTDRNFEIMFELVKNSCFKTSAVFVADDSSISSLPCMDAFDHFGYLF